MSNAAKWSYKFDITIWPNLGIDDWTGVTSWGAPVVFKGDYSAESKKMVSAGGNDFVSKQTIYTEYALAKEGDMLLIGNSTEVDPLIANAQEARLVLRYADTLEAGLEDFMLVT